MTRVDANSSECAQTRRVVASREWPAAGYRKPGRDLEASETDDNGDG